ncbi:MAG: universal stress protein [Burkholderiaceae bacterium]|jgi:nucleotide-binding universal stress UspA family protein|nr:universal stress protein [Burkholderiaceae bacterium]
MYKTILVPTDGTTLSEKAITAAIQYASTHKGCKIIGITVAETPPLTQIESLSRKQESDYISREQESARERVNHIAEQAKSANIPCEVIVSQSAHPHEEIVRAAEKYQCDCIFMASHGRKGLNRFFIGSETQKVLTTTSVPVLVYR